MPENDGHVKQTKYVLVVALPQSSLTSAKTQEARISLKILKILH